ncbi:MAG: DUF2851 family protein [Bacteroidales bacterium]|nr:DUF2851 family protein [Bacteroidales bacterium]
MKIAEDFLYYLWSLKLLRGDLSTTDGQIVSIIQPGMRNYDSGPDFFNARIKIGETEWAGNVEMHVSSSDWIKHGHQTDKAYDSVILHVVYHADMVIRNSYNEEIPTLSVQGHFPERILYRYQQLIGAREWIPCATNLKQVSDLVIYSWLDRVLVERLQRKTDFIFQILNETNNDWQEAFYITLARSFGFNTNNQPFEQLARVLPLKIITKHSDSLFQVEALLYGQAGLLNQRIKDDYLQDLLREYLFLSNKYKLQAVQSWAWKFMRMRPVNFPTIRISQFAKLITKDGHLLSKVIEVEKLQHLRELFEVDVSDYWLTHYSFGKPSKSKSKSLGVDSFDLILINTIVPFLYLYGIHQNDAKISERAMIYLQQTKPEKNGVVRRWNSSGVNAANAAQSQALLTLKNDYCTHIKCLDCAIGNAILNPQQD